MNEANKELEGKYPDLVKFKNKIKEARTPQELNTREQQYEFLKKIIENYENGNTH